MNIALYVIAALEAFSTLFTVSTVGKPRKTIEPAGAAGVVVVNAVIVTLLVLAAGRLG